LTKTTDTAGRLPPHDLDAEAAVLSALMLDGAKVHDVAGFLRPEHFYSDANGRIYEAILVLDGAQRPVDVVTIAAALRDVDRLAQVGGPSYLAQLADATPAIANIAEHACIIHDKWKIRAVIATCQRIAAEGYGEVGDAQKFASDAAAALAIVADEGAFDDGHVADGMELATRSWERATRPETQEPALRTGVAPLDRLYKMHRGNLVIIGAHSGIGKSALAQQIAGHAATTDGRDSALIFSLEMTGDEVMDRLACGIARIDSAKLDPDHGGLTRYEMDRFRDALQLVGTPRLVVDDRADHTPASIRARARSLAAKMKRAGTPLRLVVVDYCQIVSPDVTRAKDQNREREVALVGRALKKLAAELGVVVIGVAQLNEDARQKDRPPRARDLRESRALMQDANAVILIWNEAAESRVDENAEGARARLDPETPDAVKLIIGKRRSNGRTGTVRASFWPAFCTFGELDPAHMPPDPPPAPARRTRGRGSYDN
jgi:replicative DNA helicase